jgi:acyl dehydratase
MTGRFFEDFQVGESIGSAARLVTAGDVVSFAALTGDHNRLHTDEEFAAAGPFGRPIAHGVLGMGIAIGLIEQEGVHDGTTIAMMTIQEWTFRRPVLVGDRVSATMTVAAKYPSTTADDRGVVVRHLALVDADGVVYQEGLIVLLVKRRPA